MFKKLKNIFLYSKYSLPLQVNSFTVYYLKYQNISHLSNNRCMNSQLPVLMKKIFSKSRIVLVMLLGIISVTLFSVSLKAQNCTVNAGVTENVCPFRPLFLHGVATGLFTGTGNIHWTQKDGPAVQIVDPYNLNTEIRNYQAATNYNFYLWAKCDDGTLVKDSVLVSVKPLFTAHAGPDQASCPGNGILTLAGNEPDITNGETGLWEFVTPNPAGVSFTDATQYNTTISLDPSKCGVTKVIWTITGSNSCTSRDTLLITNYGGVTPVSAGGDQTLSGCYTSSTFASLGATYGGCGLNSQIGHWSLVSGPNTPTISSPNSNSTSVTNLVEGTYTFRWDVTGTCTSGFALTHIVVPHALGQPTSSTASAGGPVGPFCDGRTSFTLTGNSPARAHETGTWTQYGGPQPAIINSPNTPITTVTVPADSLGTYGFTYTIRDTLTGCGSSNSTSVSFYPAPYIFLDPESILPCGDSLATINYTAPAGLAVTYQIISGPLNGTYTHMPWNVTAATNSPQLIDHLSKVGTYTVRFSVSSGVGGNCQTQTADINIITSQLPTSSNSGTPQILACNVFLTHLAGNYPFAGSGLWIENSHPIVPDTLNPGNYFEYPAKFADSSLNTTLITQLNSGVYRFTWKISNGVACDPSYDLTRVEVADTMPTYIEAGPNRTVCYGTPIRMEASLPAINEHGQWTVYPSGPTFSNVTNPFAVVNNLAENTLYHFIWTLHNHCGTISDTALIQTTFDQGPAQANAGPDQCQPATTTAITLHGNKPDPGVGSWSQIPAATPPVTITQPTDSITTVTGLTPGTYQFEWTVGRGSCDPTMDTVTITIANAVTTAHAGPDIEICGDHSKMAANKPLNAGEVGTWTLTPGEEGSVVIDDIHSDTTNVGIVITGVYKLIWTITNGACSSNADTVVLRVSIPPSNAYAGVDRTLCGKDTLHLAATAATLGTARWSVVSGPNTPVFSSITDPHAHVSSLITGTYVFKWTITGGPFCPPSTATVTMIIYAKANAGTDQTFCDANTIELTGNVGSTGVWTLVSGPSTPTITPTIPASNKATASPLYTGTYSFRYTLTYPDCTSSDTVNITVSGQPTTSNAGPEQFLCKLSTPYTISLFGNAPDPGHGTGTWSRLWPISDGGSFSNVNDPLATYSPATPQLYIFKWTIADGTCSSASEVRVTLDDPPTTSNAGPAQQVCGTQTTMAANTPTAGIGRWTQVSGPSSAIFSSFVLPDAPEDRALCFILTIT